MTSSNELPFKVVHQPLHEILKAFPNLISREWPKHISNKCGAQLILHAFVKAAANTYETILWICAEVPHYTERKPEFILSVPPLARSILDQVFTVCFLSEDIENRAVQYHRAGWREVWEGDQLERKRYGTSEKWAPVFAEKAKLLEALASLSGVTKEEQANPKKVDYWPIPSKMIAKCLNSHVGDNLEFLEDWFYSQLSKEAHLSERGLITRGYPLVADVSSESLKDHLDMKRSDTIVITMTLVLALLSELEGILKYPGFREKLKYLWTILLQYWEDPSELYQRRYEQLLASIT